MTNILTIAPDINVKTGNVVSFDMLTKKSDIIDTNPESFMIPRMPKYRGN